MGQSGRRCGVIGGQPIVQPNGNVVVPIDNAFDSGVSSTRLDERRRDVRHAFVRSLVASQSRDNPGTSSSARSRRRRSTVTARCTWSGRTAASGPGARRRRPRPRYETLDRRSHLVGVQEFVDPVTSTVDLSGHAGADRRRPRGHVRGWPSLPNEPPGDQLAVGHLVGERRARGARRLARGPTPWR